MSIPTRNIARLLLKLPRTDTVKVVIDFVLIAMAASWAWFVSFGQLAHPGSLLPYLSVAVVARLVIYYVMRLHHMSWTHVSRYDVLWLLGSALLGPIAIGLLIGILPEPFTIRTLVRPSLILITEPALYLLLLAGVRITARALYSTQSRVDEPRRVLLVGAGAAGRALAFQIEEQERGYAIVGLVDDDPRRQGRRIRGIQIVGTTAELPRVARDLGAQEIMIAIPSLSPERLREIVGLCETTRVPVRILPPLRELMTGKQAGRINATSLREVRMEDLLPRAEVKLDAQAIAGYVNGKCVLVTGGGGSIGGELCRQAVQAGAGRILVLGRGENSVFEMIQELSELESPCDMVPVICDVRDRKALDRVFGRYGPQIVFHAAAHKHVPLMEQYPCEAIKNNVAGTLNVVELSIEHKVQSFVLVSTDKAVEPCNIMGASKRICEMIVKGHAARSGMNLVSVRFGNVLGSRGSVVPTMRRQISRRQAVTVTDPDMVRFFMTIPEAVQLILQAGAIGGNGEVFVLDMGRPVRILDLAYDLIRLSGLIPEQDIAVNIIGRRPGEKMHEDILTTAEASRAHKNGPFYVTASEQVALGELMAQIAHLRELSEQGLSDEVLSVVRRLVPDFVTHSNGAGATTAPPSLPRNVNALLPSANAGTNEHLASNGLERLTQAH